MEKVSDAPTCVSASGKVLLAGGYLVLDPEYSGTVVATSSRFFTIIKSSQGRPGKITVRSPQFRGATWRYNVSIISEITVESNPVNGNIFVATAIREVLSLSLAHHGANKLKEWLEDGLEIVIAGENDFYSQRNRLISLGLTPNLENSQRLERFTDTGTTLKEVHKTGLGSSAALITSLVASLLVHFRLVERGELFGTRFSGKALSLIHNASQYVHCLAQGKVGSGFDIASAVYGSHLYTRFDPSVINPLMASSRVTSTKLRDVLASDNAQWNQKIRPFRLPPRTKLILGDVDAGSDTPSLVSKVLKWRIENSAEAKELWDTIALLNEGFTESLNRLTKFSQEQPSRYDALMLDAAENPISEWTASEGFERQLMVDVRTSAENIRSNMRLMGELANVPIEPMEQTRLLNASTSKPGVLAGGVPGAGGYDAIWLLLAEPDDVTVASRVISEVEQVWLSWKEMIVTPLPATESRESGLKIETVADVDNLVNRKSTYSEM